MDSQEKYGSEVSEGSERLMEKRCVGYWNWYGNLKDFKLLCTIYFNFLPCQDGTFLSLIEVSVTASDWFCGILPAHY